MSNWPRIFRSERVVTPEGVREASVLVDDLGVIQRVEHSIDISPGDDPAEVVDFGDLLLLPGGVDSHVHINEPGNTDWEGFDTATAAAAAGGITTLVDMPLNSLPVTTTPAAFEEKLAAAKSANLLVDVAFWGGVCGNDTSSVEALYRAGVRGFKVFLCDSGLGGFESVDLASLKTLVEKTGNLGAPVLVHAELVPEAAAEAGQTPITSHDSWLASRPHDLEHSAVAAVIEIARETNGRIHVVHVSSPGSIEMLVKARAEGVSSISWETCPHYLAFSTGEVPDGATEYKCAPAIGTSSDRSGLRRALVGGDIDMVVSDHSPAPASMKAFESGDFGVAWGGISSLQVSLPAVMSTLTAACGLEPEAAASIVARTMSASPARLAGIHDLVGSISPGHYANFTVVDDKAGFVVDSAMLHHKNKITPWHGRHLAHTVSQTWLRGQCIYQSGVITHSNFLGRII